MASLEVMLDDFLVDLAEIIQEVRSKDTERDELLAAAMDFIYKWAIDNTGAHVSSLPGYLIHDGGILWSAYQEYLTRHGEEHRTGTPSSGFSPSTDSGLGRDQSVVEGVDSYPA